MLHDIETTNDLLNFKATADSVAALIISSGKSPISIGVSGNWGTGKSSLVKMIAESIKEKSQSTDYIFLEFNAWLYQGYEDARLALLEKVSSVLEVEAEKDKGLLEKFVKFSKRINWLKLGKLALPVLSQAALGFSLAGPVGAIAAGALKLAKEQTLPTKEEFADVDIPQAIEDSKGLLRQDGPESVTKGIEELRAAFEDILNDLNKTLVVQVDDLDRCLPDVAISTLEALRLLLFTNNTVFLIAADEEMIRSSVRNHFGGHAISESLVTSYFDKIIQVPLRVPRPGISEIKAYVLLLFTEYFTNEKVIEVDAFNKIRAEISQKLVRVWENGFARDAIFPIFSRYASIMNPIIELVDDLAPLLMNAKQISGNPRLIKRFINSYIIRKSIAETQGITISIDVFIKLMLFERCATSEAFEYLVSAISQSDDGKIGVLKEIEDGLDKKSSFLVGAKLPEPFQIDFFREWVATHPYLGDVDLRPFLYVSRETSYRFSNYDELPKVCKEIWEALLQTKNFENSIVLNIKSISDNDSEILYSKMTRKVREEQFAGSSILRVLHVVKGKSFLSARFCSFLREIPPAKIEVQLIPLLKEEAWAGDILEFWGQHDAVKMTVKKAIGTKQKTKR